MEEVIKEFAEEIGKNKKVKTARQVKDYIFSVLWEHYRGSAATKERVEWVSKDIAESVCLRLNIPQN